MIVGLYGVSLCLLMPSVLCIDGFGELGEQFLVPILIPVPINITYSCIQNHEIPFSVITSTRFPAMKM